MVRRSRPRSARGAFALRRNRNRRALRRKVGMRGYNIHNFKRLGPEITLTNNGSGPKWDGPVMVGPSLPDDFGTYQTGVALKFQLDQVIDKTDFQDLFDRYKITGVKLRFICQTNLGGGTGQAPLPIINYAFDADDATPPATESTVQTKLFCKTRILNGNKIFSVFYRPRVAVPVFQQGVTSGYASERPKWLDCAYPSIEHYGLKMWIRNWLGNDTSFSKMTIQPTYYLSCKDSM